MQGKALQDFVIDKIDDLKGQDIIALNVQGKSSITDCMIICTGTSTRHVMSIADHVVQESRAAGMDLHGMQMTQVSALAPGASIEDVAPVLVQEFVRQLGYRQVETGNWAVDDYR